ncbi:hypothetical protein C8F04DRAFT_1189722 [Mycena alexandri]|uniref:Uncharacterized protein n=1 Tax=Mycena alexandri TaxID=1745969 RepID=A0AAD6WXS5_9AGAR|nr:hypothetical protein C8F04DRAFT_1189722 [Mycena alexandri]
MIRGTFDVFSTELSIWDRRFTTCELGAQLVLPENCWGVSVGVRSPLDTFAEYFGKGDFKTEHFHKMWLCQPLWRGWAISSVVLSLTVSSSYCDFPTPQLRYFAYAHRLPYGTLSEIGLRYKNYARGVGICANAARFQKTRNPGIQSGAGKMHVSDLEVLKLERNMNGHRGR